MGTTGAAMLLIRPLAARQRQPPAQCHVVVFFIFLVANIGGSLTPLGDPPLFLGFLKGVDFFWTTQHLLLPMMMICEALLLAIFFAIDAVLAARAGAARPARKRRRKIGIDGGVNFLLLGGVVGAVLLSGVWKPGVASRSGTFGRNAEHRARRLAYRHLAAVAEADAHEACASSTPSAGARSWKSPSSSPASS